MKCQRFAVLAVMLVVSLSLLADDIVLKNGTSIVVESVVDKGETFEYRIGRVSYSIPKSAVVRIERSGGPGVRNNTASFGISVSEVAPGTAIRNPNGMAFLTSDNVPLDHGPKKKLPTPVIVESPEIAAIKREVLHDGRVDQAGLAKVESQNDAERSAVANLLAAHFELEQSNADGGRKYIERAMSFTPDRAYLHQWYSLALLELGQNAKAVASAERATTLSPENPGVWSWLGQIYYHDERLTSAVRAWKRSLALQPDENVKSWVEKAEREGSVESNFSEQQSAHFILRYQGRMAGFLIGGELLRTLERQYSEQARFWGFAPESTISVILYADRAFREVTGAPTWAEGLYDGKVRLPVKDVTAITRELEQVTMHELTHSFIFYMARGRCPRWLNEGIAQMMEPRNSSSGNRFLAKLWREGKSIPLRELESDFQDFSDEKAAVAYAESLAAAEFLREKCGSRGLRRILMQLSSGDTFELALQSNAQLQYVNLDEDLGKYLLSRY